MLVASYYRQSSSNGVKFCFIGALSPGQRQVSMDPLIALVNRGFLSNKRA